jgi:hypothetical protein
MLSKDPVNLNSEDCQTSRIIIVNTKIKSWDLSGGGWQTHFQSEVYRPVVVLGDTAFPMVSEQSATEVKTLRIIIIIINGPFELHTARPSKRGYLIVSSSYRVSM